MKIFTIYVFSNIYMCGTVVMALLHAVSPLLRLVITAALPVPPTAPVDAVPSLVRPPPPSTPLHRSFVRSLLGEDNVPHVDEKQPHRPRCGVTGPSGDGARRPATEHVSDVFRLGGSPESGRQPGAVVAPGFITELGVLHVVHRHRQCQQALSSAQAILVR